MKTKDKIILILIFAISIFLFLNTNAFASTETNYFPKCVYDGTIENFVLPEECTGSKYIIFIDDTLFKIYYTFDENVASLGLKTVTSTYHSYKYDIVFLDQNNERLSGVSYKRCVYLRNNSLDFNDFTYDRTASGGAMGLHTTIASSSGGNMFVNSNLDIYFTDYQTLVFQKPVEQLTEMMGLVPLEIMRPTQVQEKIAETLKMIVPIALMVFSALLSPFLIRYLISLKR